MSTVEERLAELIQDACEEGETIHQESLQDCRAWFSTGEYPDRPRITLTPDGTLRAHWLDGNNRLWVRSAEFLGGGRIKWMTPSGDEARDTAPSEDTKC